MDHVDAYDYSYPEDLAAQTPPEVRGTSRLLVVDRRTGALSDDSVADLPSVLAPGDLLVVNDAWVEPAKLTAVRSTGGRVRVLVVQADGACATVLLGARGKLVVGEELSVGEARWRITAAHGEGRFDVEDVGGAAVRATIDALGRMPLPPYIARGAEDDPRDALDRERYQTAYARRDGPFGAVAAPTAGLHFTDELLERLRAAGVELATIRLDVGEGTFRPMRGEHLDEHEMHRERFDVPPETVEAFAATRARGGRVVAVGTTVVRTLESRIDPATGELRAGPGSTDLFIRPGHRFAAVDALLTNFHQPRSTLLVLVSAFASRDTILAAYHHAIDRRYRLFSYGDAMLLI